MYVLRAETIPVLVSRPVFRFTLTSSLTKYQTFYLSPMRAYTSYVALAIAAAEFSSSYGHRLHHSHVARHLQMDMEMSPSMNMTSAQNASLSDEEYSCPVCGMSTKDMGYNNLNHIGFVNGQTIYTCGMAPRSFDDYSFELTDTAYLAANVAEFIINSTDASAYAECENTCDECEDGIRDPVTGDNITTSNFQYVCLNNGQKIYFASLSSKDEYLSNVNSEPRYLVDSIICGNSTCADANNITSLSLAAQAFVPELDKSNDSGAAGNTSTPTVPGGSSAANSLSSSVMASLAVGSILSVLAAIA
ncbi:conserved hypothetical protein [Plasmopara halstedii]|uniref:Uncharacterized protein n=1 Tax=Plasmopara halstedii TaxID=4781 RepID=A0A0N7L7B7_PLAHL|nr:conserved hypothetical protein [Plasmopara halstedii]CEG46627.1 conserved hypothetical protein [Plasmopara halstedii]|eukprot:XP_024582996.1 conserved hypothetical protein [Plasmopara halstedii]